MSDEEGTGDYREEEMEDGSGNELSEFKSSKVEMEEGEEEAEGWEGKGRGSPNFERAATGAGKQQSTQEFFQRGAQHSTGELNIFNTPGKTPMRGALAHSLSAAASSPQQVGLTEALNFVSRPKEGAGIEGGEGGGLEGSEGVEGMSITADDSAEEVANQEESERITTPTPTPARWATPTLVPVTPSRGSKRMAVGTPNHHRPRRATPRPAARSVLAGFAAASGLEQILGAIAQVEWKLAGAVSKWQGNMVEGLAAVMAHVEEMEKRLAVKLLAMDGIETKLAQKGQWEVKQ